MKMKLFCIAAMALTIVFANTAQAATYTMDFDESVETKSATGIFTIDPFTNIHSASIDFTIRGKTTMTNSRGYSWYYSPNIDLSVADTQLLDNQALGGDFSVLHVDLGKSALDYMIAKQSLNFGILAQDGYWYSDLSPWGGTPLLDFFWIMLA